MSPRKQVKSKRRPRRSRKAGNASALLPFAGLQRTQLRNPLPRVADPYLSCRLNPFRAVTGSGIPDGSNRDYIIVDLKCYNDITCVTSAGFIIQTLPMLPFSAVIAGMTANTNDLMIDGVAYTNTSNPTSLVAWYPLGYFPQLATQLGYYPGALTQDPWLATKARLVSIGYKLIYTGQVLQSSGTITVNPNNVGVNVGPTTTSATPSGTELTAVYENASITPTQSPKSTVLLNLDCSVNPNAYVRDASIYRPENGVTVMPKHTGPTFEVRPINTNASMLVSGIDLVAGINAVSVACAPTSGTTGAGVAPGPGVIWYDDSWSAAQIVAKGVTAGNTYRFETVMCFEMNVSGTSAFAPLAKAGSPSNPALVARANEMSSNMPLSTAGGAFRD